MESCVPLLAIGKTMLGFRSHTVARRQRGSVVRMVEWRQGDRHLSNMTMVSIGMVDESDVLTKERERERERESVAWRRHLLLELEIWSPQQPQAVPSPDSGSDKA